MSAPASAETMAQRDEALYALLCETARKGEVCPVGSELARAVDAPESSANALLKRLERQGLITVKVHYASVGGGRVNVYRVVGIVATGQRTGPPERGSQLQRAADPAPDPQTVA